ncbi:prefoldin subunit 1 [Frankliniella occidentalis]|uniref:Prefoldin subunit 1 n=1 Tax=Frankliniella occidentalis TaxID=133901 RepID=A0A6J1SKQ1_FRAOC|nr:prefoldin subunit 1 [Frankliniella occidentalis]
MAKTVDLELKKAFAELQLKMTDTAQKLKLADLQIDGLKKSKIHSELTIQELKGLPPNTNMYESVGRMFILRDAPEITQGLHIKSEKYDEKIKSLESHKAYLESNLKEAEKPIREMVKQRKA